MADNIHNLVEFTKKESFDKFIKLYFSEWKEGDSVFKSFQFNKVIPMPTCKDEDPHYFFNSGCYKFRNTRHDMTGRLAGEGFPEDFDWYNWCIEKWGTKWNAYDTYINEEKLYVKFDTAWTAPFLVFEKIAEDEPELWEDMRITSICEFNGYKRMSFCGGRFNHLKEYRNAHHVDLRMGSDLIRDAKIQVTTIDTNEENFEYFDDFEAAFPDAIKVLKICDEDDSIELPTKDLPLPPKENKWKIGETTLKLHTPIWDVMETEKTNPEGKVGKFVSLKTPDWVKAIIYNTSTRKFVITREFRQGINDYDVAFPSGTVEPGEDPMDAVKREVMEETGFKNITECKLLGAFPPNVAFMNNTMSIYYIEVDGEKTDRNLDEFEDIDMFEVNKPMDFDIKGAFDTLGWYLYKAQIDED